MRNSDRFEYRGTNSCSPKRRPIQKMRSSRASLPKPLDPLLEALERVAQARDRAGELVDLPARHEHALLVHRVVRERLDQPPRRVGVPPGKRSARAGDAVRGHVAEEPGEVLLDIPAQVARERAY